MRGTSTSLSCLTTKSRYPGSGYSLLLTPNLTLQQSADPMPSRRQLISSPIYRFILAAITVVLLMHLLRSSWKSKDTMSPGSGAGYAPVIRERKAVAHFMVRLSHYLRDYAQVTARQYVPIHRAGLEDHLPVGGRNGIVSLWDPALRMIPDLVETL